MKQIVKILTAALILAGCAKEPVVYPVNPGTGPEKPGDKPGETAPEATLKICSFNVRISSADDGENSWAYRKASAMKFINTEKPDMIGMQELKFQAVEDFTKEVGSDYFIYSINRETGSALTSNSGEACGILLRKDRFKVVDKGYFWLSDTPDQKPDAPAWGGACKRITVWVKAQDLKKDNKEVYFFNTHYDHESQEARTNSSPLMLSRMKSISGAAVLKNSPAPVFMMGDLNCEWTDASVQALAGQLDYARNQAPETDHSITYNGYKNTGGKIIDHIFYGGLDIVPLRYKVMNGSYGAKYVSDHYPIMFTCKYKD